MLNVHCRYIQLKDTHLLFHEQSSAELLFLFLFSISKVLFALYIHKISSFISTIITSTIKTLKETHMFRFEPMNNTFDCVLSNKDTVFTFPVIIK